VINQLRKELREPPGSLKRFMLIFGPRSGRWRAAFPNRALALRIGGKLGRLGLVQHPEISLPPEPPIVALHVNLDKTSELSRETFTA
jgi:hypothetical protein